MRTDNIEIVVADLLYPMNIGSIARTMYCAGFKKLTLVRPCKKWNSMDAIKFSLFGRPILENAKVHKSLEEIRTMTPYFLVFHAVLAEKEVFR
ncbi:MAG: TrmH family RNA methyltransferase [Pseudomonadota bacterium]